jgi:hypothetical protein
MKTDPCYTKYYQKDCITNIHRNIVKCNGDVYHYTFPSLILFFFFFVKKRKKWEKNDNSNLNIYILHNFKRYCVTIDRTALSEHRLPDQFTKLMTLHIFQFLNRHWEVCLEWILDHSKFVSCYLNSPVLTTNKWQFFIVIPAKNLILNIPQTFFKAIIIWSVIYIKHRTHL